MEEGKNILDDLIYITENLYIQTQLSKIQEIIKNTPNDLLLGKKLREIL